MLIHIYSLEFTSRQKSNDELGFLLYLILNAFSCLVDLYNFAIAIFGRLHARDMSINFKRWLICNHFIGWPNILFSSISSCVGLKQIFSAAGFCFTLEVSLFFRSRIHHVIGCAQNLRCYTNDGCLIFTGRTELCGV